MNLLFYLFFILNLNFDLLIYFVEFLICLFIFGFLFYYYIYYNYFSFFLFYTYMYELFLFWPLNHLPLLLIFIS